MKKGSTIKSYERRVYWALEDEYREESISKIKSHNWGIISFGQNKYFMFIFTPVYMPFFLNILEFYHHDPILHREPDLSRNIKILQIIEGSIKYI